MQFFTAHPRFFPGFQKYDWFELTEETALLPGDILVATNGPESFTAKVGSSKMTSIIKGFRMHTVILDFGSGRTAVYALVNYKNKTWQLQVMDRGKPTVLKPGQYKVYFRSSEKHHQA